jgi:predicted transcriptional regulator YheO
MKRIRHTSEQIIAKLREAEVLLQKGEAVPQVCRRLGVTVQTYYLYGGRSTVACGWTRPSG